MELKLYKLIVESSPNMIWKSGIDGKCDYFNNTWLGFTGKTLEQEMGNGWAEGVHPDDLESCLKIYLESFSQRQPFEMEYRLLRFDGEYRWIDDRGVPFYNDNGNFAGYIGSCIDVTEKVEGEQLRKEAQVDGLTGTNNRQFFEKLFKTEFEKAIKYRTMLSVILMDVDDFKSINDVYGHLIGDQVLTNVVNVIESSLRDSDFCGRYGGEEFVVALPNTSLEQAIKVAERLRQQIENNSVEIEGRKIKVTVSLGVTQLSNEKEAYRLIDKADKAMYSSKTRGKNQVTIAD
ncbi:MAG: sensor domain-containing diguanylate cyclase [Thermincola sp.]|jgi:diguanylate cyclase (GGDEF)-like protein/PAS domain S-box-containing protein|nr:sensor domain-containing diguanylate cyclase [Thermincola sp.]MDT3702010.1 sensor domain-containing diguanylate cyclase [Thermincola sp.]